MIVDRRLLTAFVVAFAIGYWYAGHGAAPTPPAQDRPILKMIARVAKTFLWVALVAEPPPAGPQDRQLVHAPPVAEDGYAIVDHGRGL